MNDATPGTNPWDHAPRFRRRRTLNWLPLGITYALLYTARYNFTIANVSIACERGWGIAEISRFITIGLAVYAFSTFFNGPLADRIGGRRAILISSGGAGLCNLLFAYVGGRASINTLLVLWAFNQYFQSFGALSVVKVNAAWFHVRERGSFSGIFGTMIQSGRWMVLSLGGFLLAARGWRALYYLPGAALLVAFAVNFALVRDNPEDAGLGRLDTGDETAAERATKVTLGFVLRKIFTSKIAWMIAAANFCTGFVRHGIEQYWRIFFDNAYHLNTSSLSFQFVANIGFVSGVVGSMTAGVVSDRYFGSRRGPVAAIWYTGQFIVLAIFAAIVPAVAAVLQTRGVSCAPRHSSGQTLLVVMLSLTASLVVLNFIAASTRGGLKLAWYALQIAVVIGVGVTWGFLRPGAGGHALHLFAQSARAAGPTTLIVLLQFLVGGAHGLLAGTASMDYGGRKAAATAAGFFDGVQYLAGSIGGLLFGYVLHAYGWRGWIPTITPFALIGAGIMALLWQAMPAGSRKAAH